MATFEARTVRMWRWSLKHLSEEELGGHSTRTTDNNNSSYNDNIGNNNSNCNNNIGNNNNNNRRRKEVEVSGTRCLKRPRINIKFMLMNLAAIWTYAFTNLAAHQKPKTKNKNHA